MIDPIAQMHDAWAAVWAHKGLLLGLLIVGLVLIVAFFVARWIFVRVDPVRIPVRRVIKRWKRDAARYPFTPDTLRTRGSADGRVPRADVAHIRGGLPKPSAWIVPTRPFTGLLRWFKTDLMIVPMHLVHDVHTSVLEVDATSFQQHGPLWWPNDDLSDPKIRAAWEALLLEKGEKSVPVGELQARIPHWYLRVLEMDVQIETGIDIIDVTAENVVSSMSRDFSRNAQRYSEIAQQVDDPMDPASESVVRG